MLPSPLRSSSRDAAIDLRPHRRRHGCTCLPLLRGCTAPSPPRPNCRCLAGGTRAAASRTQLFSVLDKVCDASLVGEDRCTLILAVKSRTGLMILIRMTTPTTTRGTTGTMRKDQGTPIWTWMMKIVPLCFQILGGEIDIQGIQWERLAITRENYREIRLQQYKNYKNILNSGEAAAEECKQSEKDGMYYEFRKNTRSVKSTILHF
ncbi:uncharacterized protein LOC123401158 isoform X2 [Hordeum vulgare subsp. vulgare]|uniref:uncharacterized protein LOC123401158 isoform X2 n=1 Tax=Hordeum vulgare subsp. vulgare TaxID=112509 RepID=UPI001D1A37D1|nr:uncharacterized protein LOC123401158 isoform X2 [Hordeum vulgare subsp. vulgare]